MTYCDTYESPIGRMIMTSDGECLTGLYFKGQKYEPAGINEIAYQSLEVFDKTKKWLDIYFSGKVPDFIPELKIPGSDFRRLVAQIMLTIPYGETMTYKEIADIAANELHKKKMSAQAAGGAVGHNAISIIIPCHRVIGSDGHLTGYAGGLDKKAYLLDLEHALHK